MFSRDGGNDWQPVALNIEGNRWKLDPTSLPGTASGRLRLIVTDGMNTTIVDSTDNIVVEPKAPRAFITDPTDNAVVPEGARLMLRVTRTRRKQERFLLKASPGISATRSSVSDPASRRAVFLPEGRRYGWR
jgi:hypothetical protein